MLFIVCFSRINDDKLVVAKHDSYREIDPLTHIGEYQVDGKVAGGTFYYGPVKFVSEEDANIYRRISSLSYMTHRNVLTKEDFLSLSPSEWLNKIEGIHAQVISTLAPVFEELVQAYVKSIKDATGEEITHPDLQVLEVLTENILGD